MRKTILITLCLISLFALAACIGKPKIAVFNDLTDGDDSPVAPAEYLKDDYGADAATWKLSINGEEIDISDLAAGGYTEWIPVTQKAGEAIVIIRTRTYTIGSTTTTISPYTNYIFDDLAAGKKYLLSPYGYISAYASKNIDWYHMDK